MLVGIMNGYLKQNTSRDVLRFIFRVRLDSSSPLGMELQAINYITSHIEKLPIADNSHMGERLPSLFQHQDGAERIQKCYKVNKTGDHKRHTSRYNPLMNLNEHAKSWLDATHDMKPKGRQTIFELLGARDKTATYRENSPSLQQRDDSVATNAYRRKSTDSTGSESSRSICDEEVRRIGLPESRTIPSVCTQLAPQSSRECYNRSGSAKKRLLSEKSTDQKRVKTHNFQQYDARKKRSLSSNSWLPARLRSCEKRVKVIRIAPFNDSERDLQTYYGDRIHEEAFFRPIRADEG